MKHSIQVFYPPNVPTDIPDASIFLAGTIDMGASENWQEETIRLLKQTESLAGTKIHIYNPRRLDWNVDWKQSIDNGDFKTQVDWELDAISSCDVVAFNILADSKSPITLMELGLCAGMRTNTSLVVRCEPGFWRKGNVDILADRYKILQVSDFKDWVNAIASKSIKK